MSEYNLNRLEILRFANKIRVPADPNGCWEWLCSKFGGGYGRFNFNSGNSAAHRICYELIRGSIPDGFQLDHLCRNRWCVNPQHLEPVTRKENILRGNAPSALCARKTHCPKGHPYSGANLYISKTNSRKCRTCIRDNMRAFRIKIKRSEAQS